MLKSIARKTTTIDTDYRVYTRNASHRQHKADKKWATKAFRKGNKIV